jgi:hypothetical protein
MCPCVSFLSKIYILKKDMKKGGEGGISLVHVSVTSWNVD